MNSPSKAPVTIREPHKPEEHLFLKRIESLKVSQELEKLSLNRQQIYFAGYVSEGMYSATECAKRAGYAHAGAHVQACRLLKEPKIKKAIEIFSRESLLAFGTEKRLIREYLLEITKANYKEAPAVALTALKQLAELDGHVTKHGAHGSGGSITINISGLSADTESAGTIIEQDESVRFLSGGGYEEEGGES